MSKEDVPSPSDTQSTSILIADHLSTVRRMMSGQLKKLGYTQLHETGDSPEAIEVMKREKVDLVIADWSMPALEHASFFDAVRKQAETKPTHCLIVATPAQRTEIEKKFRDNVPAILVKPFTAEILAKKIAEVQSAED